jgi:hypothetical protein
MDWCVGDFDLLPVLGAVCLEKAETFNLKEKKMSYDCALRNCALAVTISKMTNDEEFQALNVLIVESANNLTCFYLALFSQYMNKIDNLHLVSNSTSWKIPTKHGLPFRKITCHSDLRKTLKSQKGQLDVCFLDVCNSAVGAIEYICDSFRSLRMKPKAVWGFSFLNERHRVSYDTKKYDKEILDIMDDLGHFIKTQDNQCYSHLRYVLCFINFAAKRQNILLEKIWYSNNPSNNMQTMIFVAHRNDKMCNMIGEYSNMQVFYSYWSKIDITPILADYVLNILDELNTVDDIIECKQEYVLRNIIYRTVGATVPMQNDDYVILPQNNKKHKAGVACAAFKAVLNNKNGPRRVKMKAATLQNTEWCYYCKEKKRKYISW